MDWELIVALKNSKFYKGRLRDIYEPILQDRLAVGRELTIYADPAKRPGILVAELDTEDHDIPDEIYETTITLEMAKELKASDLKEDYGEVWIPWTPACDKAHWKALCLGCRNPLSKTVKQVGDDDSDYYQCRECGWEYDITHDKWIEGWV